MRTKLSTRGLKALEITMRDVLDGLDDAASYMNFNSVPDTLEILSIEPPGRTIKPSREIIQFNPVNNPKRSTNIVDYLIQRELKKYA